MGIWIVSVWIDRRLKALALASTGMFLVSAFVLAAFGETFGLVLAAIVVWGLAFGGAASLFQTASARVAGKDTDLAQSMVVTTWKLAIAGGGGLLGGAIVRLGGAADLSWSAALLLTITGWVILRHHKEGFA